jgi:hypothetical protein
MGRAIAVRTYYTIGEVREFAKRAKDAAQHGVSTKGLRLRGTLQKAENHSRIRTLTPFRLSPAPLSRQARRWIEAYTLS